MNVIILQGSNRSDSWRRKTKEYIPRNLKNWIPWIKEKLEEKGIICFTPLMPNSWAPKYKEWKVEFEKLPIDENSILVGHSAGGLF